MDTKPLLHQAHFQLTGRCNLACRFCGQSKGMLAAEAKSELPLSIWLRAANELKTSAERAGLQPEVMLWGGEPLLYPRFDELAKELHDAGFKLGMVTNGTCLGDHIEAVSCYIDRINISMDGTRPQHDAMRGSGVFDKVRGNLEKLTARRGKLIFLTTVSDLNIDGLSDLPGELAKLGPDEIVLQPLMYLTQNEIDAYRKFSREEFGCDYPELSAWHREDDTGYLAKLKRELESIHSRRYPLPVRFTRHHYPMMEAGAKHCDAAWHRVHIRHDGAVGFCTDYFGFSAGNILNQSLDAIFTGAAAEKFRRAVRDNLMPLCDHCPWRMQEF